MKKLSKRIRDVQLAYYETSVKPCGTWRKFWTMHLLSQARASKSKIDSFTLPRGFTKKTKPKVKPKNKARFIFTATTGRRFPLFSVNKGLHKHTVVCGPSGSGKSVWADQHLKQVENQHE